METYFFLKSFWAIIFLEIPPSVSDSSCFEHLAPGSCFAATCCFPVKSSLTPTCRYVETTSLPPVWRPSSQHFFRFPPLLFWVSSSLTIGAKWDRLFWCREAVSKETSEVLPVKLNPAANIIYNTNQSVLTLRTHRRAKDRKIKPAAMSEQTVVH